MGENLENKIEVYLSHSWRAEDVPLNLLVWDQLSANCLLSVDRQGAVHKKGSFFVNRIEYLIRQSDAFVSVLAYRSRDTKNSADMISSPMGGESGTADRQLLCSKAALFEVRLAERARKPRLVIYDRRTRFRPPSFVSKLIRYLPVNVNYELNRGGPAIQNAVDEWLSVLLDRREQGLFTGRNDVTILLDEASSRAVELEKAIIHGLRDSRFSKVHLVRAHHLDSEIVSMLQSSDLFIAEVGSVDSGVLGLAHALFVPTIRITTTETHQLPALLTGHAFGYDRDIVLAGDTAKLPDAIRDRVSAMDEDRRQIADAQSGRAYLQSKLNRKHKVFLSHNLEGDDASLIQRIINRLNEHAINAWEYRDRMTSGKNWKAKLEDAMSDSTHVVFIAGHGFESSPACHQELTYFEQEERFGEEHVFPFLWERDNAIAAYTDVDNPKLPANSLDEAADVVTKRLQQVLRDL